MIDDSQKFFLYALKSTDTEEKQAASIPAQLRELTTRDILKGTDPR
jgi:hypothetical protein